MKHELMVEGDSKSNWNGFSSRPSIASFSLVTELLPVCTVIRMFLEMFIC